MPGGPQASAVRGRRDLAAFVAFPYELHRRDPLFSPPLRRDVRAMLSREKNPFFERAEAEYFLARRGSAVVGRVAAIHNRAHNDFHGDRTGFFGFFECADDLEAARALLDAAAGWLRGRGLDRLRGPASFSTNDEAGLLVDGFATPPVLLMPHNPPYYVGLVEACGLAKAKDLLAYQSTHDRLPARLVEGTNLLRERYGVSTRPLDMRRFDEELEVVKRVYNQAWERNWGFVPMRGREIDHLAARLKPIVVPELVAFAERQGEVVGFAAALPDLNVALRANRSGRLFPGLLKVLWAARRVDRLRVLMLGAMPAWRRRGVDGLLFRHIWEQGVARGYRWAEAGWILEDNQVMRNGLERMGFEVYKTYRLYDRPL
ncbi:MAG TPA: N-acetyltransferase [Vicinamibacteria bacterium]